MPSRPLRSLTRSRCRWRARLLRLGQLAEVVPLIPAAASRDSRKGFPNRLISDSLPLGQEAEKMVAITITRTDLTAAELRGNGGAKVGHGSGGMTLLRAA